MKRVSDFTIFDCWHVNKANKAMDDDRGATWVIVQSEKGKEFFESIKLKTTYTETSVDTAIKLDGEIVVIVQDLIHVGMNFLKTFKHIVLTNC